MPAKGSKKVGGKWVKPAVQRVAKPAPKSRKRKAARDLVPLTAYNGWQRLVMTRGVAKDLNPMGSVMQAIRDQVRAHLRKRRRVGDVGEMLQRLFDASLIHRLRPGHLANFSIEEDDIPDGATYVASDSDSDSEEVEEAEVEKAGSGPAAGAGLLRARGPPRGCVGPCAGGPPRRASRIGSAAARRGGGGGQGKAWGRRSTRPANPQTAVWRVCPSCEAISGPPTSAPLSCASGARGRLTSLTTVPMM
eukprot:TRINITY_DN11049_c0_g1_i7.p2 TRINITY_DN11049_c0_g1~~TRINITY_DN11049_c0_g1_i7.p2  ORF type:complete len:248 (-),score=3.45 TRINITY_DN11049_c0_g1_i7:298-1041(-)